MSDDLSSYGTVTGGSADLSSYGTVAAAPTGKTGLATKLGRPAVADNASAQDHAFVDTALSDQSIPHPIMTGLAHGAADTAGTLVSGLLGEISPAELLGTRPGQVLTKLLSHPKVVKAAKDAAMEWADTIPGVKAVRKTADAAKTAYGVAKDVLSPEAEALDTSALPVKPAPAAAEPPPDAGIHGGVEGQPIPGRMDDLLSSMKQRLTRENPDIARDFREVPANQDRYDIGSGAPVMKPKAKAAKAAAGDTSLEDQLSASVEKAKAGKPAAAQAAPAGENYKPGDTVWLPNRGHVLITKLNGDGTFDYTMGK